MKLLNIGSYFSHSSFNSQYILQLIHYLNINKTTEKKIKKNNNT